MWRCHRCNKRYERGQIITADEMGNEYHLLCYVDAVVHADEPELLTGEKLT